MKRIYYTVRDNGDGSHTVEFFDSQKCIDYLEENDCETYGTGEGGGFFDIEGTVSEIHIQTMSELFTDKEDPNED